MRSSNLVIIIIIICLYHHAGLLSLTSLLLDWRIAVTQKCNYGLNIFDILNVKIRINVLHFI